MTSGVELVTRSASDGWGWSSLLEELLGGSSTNYAPDLSGMLAVWAFLFSYLNLAIGRSMNCLGGRRDGLIHGEGILLQEGQPNAVSAFEASGYTSLATRLPFVA